MAKSQHPPPTDDPKSHSTRPFPFPDVIDPWIKQTLIQGVLNNDLAPLDLAVSTAQQADVPQMRDWGITDAQSFLLFTSGMLTWVPSEVCDGKLIYYILCMLNFVLDQPPLSDATFSTPINPSSVGQPLKPLSKWVVDFSVRVGAWMSSPGSITKESIQTFQASPLYHYDETLVPAGGWQTFNQLFARHLKPGMRPISAGSKSDPNYDRVAVYPADSTFDGAWPINDNAEVVIKNLPWKISDLLAGSKYAAYFEGGVWMHSFLNTFDYHRQHAPVGGTVVEANVIQGLCYLNVLADPDTGKLKQHRSYVPPEESGSGGDGDGLAGTLDAPDDAGYQFLQSRGCVIIENELLGYVAVLPIGMAQVSSVKLAWEPSEGGSYPINPMAKIDKGDEISHFEFGGSDIVVVFQKSAQMQILGAQGVDAQGNLTNKQKYLVGMPLGFSTKGSS